MKNQDSPGDSLTSRRRMRTRMALIGAAQAVVDEKGFRDATLGEIAARAGLTVGVLHSNFATKEDLFLAVMRAKGWRLRPVYPKHPTYLDVMTALGEACAEVLLEARCRSPFIAEFHLYVLTHPEMAKRVSADYADRFAKRARELAAQIPADELPMHPAVLVVVTQSLALGLLMQHFLTPDRVTPEVVIAAFEALAA